MAPSNLGRFEIVSEIAHSPHACVYKATDSSTGRTVALKAFELDLPGVDRQELLARLVQEAESTRNLTHQNIVALFGAGEIDGRFCAAMEYIEGMSIAGTLAKGETFSIWDVLDISRQVCNALDQAQQKDLVHRRLQPANIIVGWDGTVKILGYGTSGMWDEEDIQSEPSPALHYMAPEQVRGEALTPLSNLFNWGAILYEMVTSKKPFPGATAADVRHQIVQGEPKAPISLLPRMHPELSKIILKALAKNPADRFQNSRELLNALESCKEAPKTVGAKAAASKSAGSGAKPSPFVNSAPAEAKPAKKALSPYGVPIEEAAPTHNWKAAAAAASAGPGAEMVGVGEMPGTQDFTSSVIRASAALEEETAAPATAPKPRFSVDPAMAGGGVASARKSFSDVAELPPLKADVLPPPPPEPEPEPEPVEKVELPTTVFRASAKEPEKKKFTLPPMPKIDPKLLIYGIGGGLVVVLLFALGLGLFIHFHTSDDEGVTPPPVVNEKPAEAPPQAAPAPEPAAAAPANEPTPEPAPVAAAPSRVAPQGKKGKRGRTAEPLPTPIVIPGQLSVNSTPEGAQIHVDGRTDASWITPFTLTGLNPGSHVLSVSKPGFAAETRTLDIASGTKSFLTVHLNTLGATASLTSDPAGASIYVDGRDTGRVTPAQVSLDKGSHNFMIRKAGFLEESTTVELQAGQTFQFGPHLRPLGNAEDIKTISKARRLFGGGDTPAGMGRVTIRTTPKGAQIAVNQRLLDRVSPVEFVLNPGTYVLDITFSGYKPLHKVITVEQGGRLALDEKLDPQ